MKSYTFLIILIIICVGAGGCSLGPSSVLDPKRPPASIVSRRTSAEADRVQREQETLVDSLEKKAPRPLDVEPVMPRYDPLEDQIVSFSMVDEDLRLVLYSLAQSVGMNLILDPALGEEKRLITLNFRNVPASTVLKEILETYNLYYQVEKNVIRVRPFDERFYNLNFLDASVIMSFDMGGDVLGAGQTESAAGLAGTFKLSGKGANQGNAYDILETAIKRIISRQGKYSLNRLSGSLYVKDRPAVIRAVSRLVHQLKEVMSRQILIEAQIIEVSLSDAYSYGNDWTALRRSFSSGTRVESASWALGKGLVLSGVHGAFSLAATLNALRTFGDAKIVSNPSIRAKHGKPALISVGTSISYKKSVTTTTSASTTTTEESTDVEVSTVFDGLILGLVPFIEENGGITLLINPIKSDVDPDSIVPVSVTSNSADSISLPKVSIKEISTTIGVHSGDVIFLGGLIDRKRQTEEKGVPFLSSIPLLGYLFKNESMRDETRELVIVLRVQGV